MRRDDAHEDVGASAAMLRELRGRLQALGEEVSRCNPRAVPTDLRQEHVLVAATIAFVADGFDGTSMERIADLAGVTKPVVYSLHESKEALFAAVIDRISDELTTLLSDAVRNGEGAPLERAVRAYLEYVVARQDLWGRLLVSSNHRAVLAAVDRLRAQQVATIAAAVHHAREVRGLPADPRESEALATGVMAAVDGMGRWWLAHDDIDLDALVTFIGAAVRPMVLSDAVLPDTVLPDRPGSP